MNSNERKVYTVTLYGGRMGLNYGTKEEIRREEGTANILSIIPTTKKDIEWVQAMGGYVPMEVAK